MNKTLLEILQSREDISDYVFHFTKHANAYETLQTILDGKAIKDVNPQIRNYAPNMIQKRK